MRWLTMAFLLMLGLVVPLVAPVSGDEVIFLNGDRLSGKILTASGGKLTIKTEGAGDVTDDRLTFGVEYYFGRQKDPNSRETSTTMDYGMAFAKYDHFFTKKLYSYILTKAERDGVAELELRLAPGAGVGYQWFEGPKFNF